MSETYKYLNDEELETLIAEVEQNSMIAPPAYLKDEIFSKIRKEEAEKTAPRADVPNHVNEKTVMELQRKAKLQFIIYSTKIIAAAAAAVICLTVVPLDTARPMMVTAEDSIEQRISKDVEQYKEEQLRIEKEMEKQLENQAKGEANTEDAKKGFLKSKLDVRRSDIPKIINNISNIFKTEE